MITRMMIADKIKLENFFDQKNIEYTQHYITEYSGNYTIVYNIYHNNGYRLFFDYYNNQRGYILKNYNPNMINIHFKEWSGTDYDMYHHTKIYPLQKVCAFELLEDLLWYIESFWLCNHIKG